MIAHLTLLVSDFAKSKVFYAAVLDTLGYRNNMQYDAAAGFNDGKNTDFWISKTRSVVPTHVAFEPAANRSRRFTMRVWQPVGRTTAVPGIAIIGPGTLPHSCAIRTATISRPSGTTTRRQSPAKRLYE